MQNYTKAGGVKKADRMQRDSFRVKIKTLTFCKIYLVLKLVRNSLFV